MIDERNCVSHSLHVSQWISRLSYSIGCPKSQSLARLREIAKINTRKIVAIPKSQNFVLANNSNNKVVVVCFWIGMIVSDAPPDTSCPRKSGAICTESTSEDRGKHQACICQCTTLDKKKKKNHSRDWR